MARYVYTMNGVTKVVPPRREILKDISLSFFPGAKIGVLGLNGAGKSSLLRIMAGVDRDHHGEARPRPGLRVGYLPQEPALDLAKDVRGNVEEGVDEVKRLLERFDAIGARFAEPLDDGEMNALLEEQGRLQDAIEAADGWEIDRRLEVAAEALRLPPWEAPVERLSGGERRRVALCRLLLSAPDMLLLDEPTNHLDAESVAWMERYLEEFPGTVVAVTHDRYFLDNVAGWILELDRGRGIPWEGNYSSWLSQKERRLAQEEREESAHRRAVRAELEWIRANPKGRQAKSRARVQRFEELISREFQKRSETRQIHVPPGPRLGDLVVEAVSVHKAFEGRVLIDDLSFNLPAGGIVGVIGGNGAGKTTLLRMIAGLESPDAGTFRIGETVSVAYVDQSRDALAGEHTVWREISGGHEVITVGRLRDQLTRIRRTLQLPGNGPGEAGWRSLRRRAQPRPPREAARQGRQPAAPRRAHQRPRRRDPARPRGSAARLSRLRGHRVPRPLVPRPARNAYARVRGGWPGGVVRGQPRGLRGGPAPAARRRGGAAPPRALQAPRRLSRPSGSSRHKVSPRAHGVESWTRNDTDRCWRRRISSGAKPPWTRRTRSSRVKSRMCSVQAAR